MAIPTAAFSISLHVKLQNAPGVLGRLTTAIREAGGNIAGIGGFEAKEAQLTEHICPEMVVPSVFDKTVPLRVAELVAAAAVSDGVVRQPRLLRTRNGL